ncbi:protein C2-DOMAIN ABA-RELATED 5-like [Wolffia australiana]
MSSARSRAGTLKVRVIRGRNLAMRDIRGSDPYVVLSTKNEKVKTKVIKKNINPEWNEDLTLYVQDSTDPVLLEVFDKDWITRDDPIGRANINFQALVEAVEYERHEIGTVHLGLNGSQVIKSEIHRHHGRVIQEIILRLENVECGEVELQLEWIGTRGAWR